MEENEQFFWDQLFVKTSNVENWMQMECFPIAASLDCTKARPLSVFSSGNIVYEDKNEGK